jgi:hypothetical protein
MVKMIRPTKVNATGFSTNTFGFNKYIHKPMKRSRNLLKSTGKMKQNISPIRLLSFFLYSKIPVQIVPVFILLKISFFSFSQTADTTKPVSHFSGYIALTNKGISSLPNLTLGKPAVIIYLSAGRKLRFEPEFRIGLNAKPWMFIFWWRYDLANTDKIYIKARVNATIVFNTITVTTNNVSNDIMGASRTLTVDLASSYLLTKHIGIGPYYLYTYGIEINAIKNTHLLGLRASFSNIKLSDQFFMGFNPMVYLLNMDKNHGYYANATCTLARRNFPLSVMGLINKTIKTEIPIGENLLWNVSLIYTFSKNYVEH